MLTSLILLSAVGCQKEQEATTESESTDVITVTLTGKELVETKAGAESATATSVFLLESEDGENSMWVTRSVRASGFGEGAVTKGAPVTTDNLETLYDGNIGITAYQKADDSSYETEPYIPASVLQSDGKGKWQIMDGETPRTYLWAPKDLMFWSWAPKDGLNPAFDGASASFTYTMPAPSDDKKDAEAMPDLLFTGTLANSGTDKGKADLHLEHALAALRFEIGKTNDCTIETISLKSLCTQATFTYTYGAGETIAWSGLTDPEDYAQNFGDTVTEHLIDDENVQTIGTDAKTFMVIPQSSGEEAGNTITLEVVYCFKGSSTPVTVSKVLDAESSGWKAGYTYTYTLSILNGLDIEIDDKVEDNVKKDLQISNVGGRDAYIRALVVGYWVNTAGDIVALWDPNDANVGTFVPNIFASTPVLNEHWVKGADGFFYYKHILPGKTAIPADKTLFTTYTVNPEGKPKNLKQSDYLEIDIVMQAVAVDAGKAAITTAWGATAAGFVE